MKYVSRMCCINSLETLVLASTSPSRIIGLKIRDGAVLWDIGMEVYGQKVVPAGICSDNSELLYIADNQHHWVLVLNGISGNYVRVFLLQTSDYIWDVCWLSFPPNLVILYEESVTCYDVSMVVSIIGIMECVIFEKSVCSA